MLRRFLEIDLADEFAERSGRRGLEFKKQLLPILGQHVIDASSRATSSSCAIA